jgi:hypothetical protein
MRRLSSRIKGSWVLVPFAAPLAFALLLVFALRRYCCVGSPPARRWARRVLWAQVPFSLITVAGGGAPGALSALGACRLTPAGVAEF